LVLPNCPTLYPLTFQRQQYLSCRQVTVFSPKIVFDLSPKELSFDKAVLLQDIAYLLKTHKRISHMAETEVGSILGLLDKCQNTGNLITERKSEFIVSV
jgi:hypothetical protein